MTKEKFAEIINGREYREEITKKEEALASQHGLVVLFGASDDLAEFRGSISTEVDCYDGGDIFINRNGVLPNHDDDCSCEWCGYEAAKKKAVLIKAIWDKNGYSWQYETKLPHSTFEITDEGGKYCKGIVFNHKDL